MGLSVDLIIKITGFGLIAAAAERLLEKAGKDDFALVLSLLGTVIVITAFVPEVAALFELLRETFGV